MPCSLALVVLVLVTQNDVENLKCEWYNNVGVIKQNMMSILKSIPVHKGPSKNFTLVLELIELI